MNTIDVAAYTNAFRTWIRLAIAAEDHEREDPLPDDMTARLVAVVEEGCTWLEQRHRGVVAIETLCTDLATWTEGRPETQSLPLAHKSCLLDRMIYGGEQLRTRECPIHLGHWSGIGECPAGCGSGNITGWLPNDLVVDNEWPAIAIDSKLAAIEAADTWDPETLSVYADRLQQLGDPRGDAIALGDATAWLGSLAQPWVRVVDGFLHVTLAEPDHVRAIFDAPAGRYIRSVTIDGGYANSPIARYFATRVHAHVTSIDIIQIEIGVDERAALEASCPKMRACGRVIRRDTPPS